MIHKIKRLLHIGGEIVLAFIIALAITGCTYDNTDPDKQDVNINVVVTSGCSSSFADEHYVWESLTFPTNRTSGVQ